MHIFINFIQLELDEMLNMREYLQLMMKKNCGKVVSWDEDPQSSSKCCIFHRWKMFCLRGGVELRELKPSQIKRHTNPDRYIYSEKMSKNRNGTFKQLNIANKVVPLFSCPEAGERCPVHILDVYFRKLPKESITKDIFFFRPLEKTPSDPTSPWYSSQPVGKHTLEVKLSRMCSLAGIESRITNHSLRALWKPWFKNTEHISALLSSFANSHMKKIAGLWWLICLWKSPTACQRLVVYKQVVGDYLVNMSFKKLAWEW